MAAESERLADRAQRLRELRKLAHLTQEGAAHGIGVTLKTYQAWEAGGEIRTTNLHRLAEFFGTTPDWIEYGDRRPEPGTSPGLLDRLAALEDAVKNVETLIERRGQAEADQQEELLKAVDQQIEGAVLRAVEQLSRAVEERDQQQSQGRGERPPESGSPPSAS